MVESLENSHFKRLKCIYLDDLIAAVQECHENFLLLKKNIHSVNKQLLSRRCPSEADKILRTEKGLVQEHAYRLQEAMKDVLQAVGEHYFMELKGGTEKPSQDKLWTIVEDLMSQTGATGSNLLMQLTKVVAEEHRILQKLEQGYSLEDDLSNFKSSTLSNAPSSSTFTSVLEAEQCAHVQSFLRSRQLEKDTADLESKIQELRQEYMNALEHKTKLLNKSPTSESQLRDLREDWSRGIDERLELASMKAEAKCLEEIRERLQEDVQSCLIEQESLSVSRNNVDKLRGTVRYNQDVIQQLTRRNTDGRKQLEATRAEVHRLSDWCSRQLHQLSANLKATFETRLALEAEAEGRETSVLVSPSSGGKSHPPTLSLPNSHGVSAESMISRLARQVVAENEQRGIGQVSYSRLFDAMRAQSAQLGDLLERDLKNSDNCTVYKKPLIEMAKNAMKNSERSIQELEKMIKEREELPKALQLS